MEQQEKNERIYRDWESVFSEHRESGTTVKDFCEDHGIVSRRVCFINGASGSGPRQNPDAGATRAANSMKR